MKKLDKLRGMLVGLAVGDALGAPVEFKRRDSFPEVTDYQNGGPHNLKAGFWTDDTSMALCTAASLIHKGGMDADDQLARYLRWYRDGYMSSTGVCFDIGNQTRKQLELFDRCGSFSHLSALRELEAVDDRAGNGALMRLAPVVIKYHADLHQVMSAAALNSQLTHIDQRCVDANKVLAYFMIKSLDDPSKSELLRAKGITTDLGRLHPDVSRIVEGSYRSLRRSGVQSTGYVIHSLEAALWAFYKSESFEEGAKLAVNLGGDADTIGAIYGQLAGAFWGYNSIPHDWVKDLYQYEKIILMADLLAQGFTEDHFAALLHVVDVELPPTHQQIMRREASQTGIANQYCWNDLQDMPRDQEMVKINIKLDQREFSAVTRGWIPDDMGEKMFMYFNGSQLFMHRSWSGYCAYVVNFKGTNPVNAQINMSIVKKSVTLAEMTEDLLGWIRVLISRNLEDTPVELVNKNKMLTHFFTYEDAYHHLPVAHHYVIEDELYIKNLVCLDHAKERYERGDGVGWRKSMEALDDAIEQHNKVLKRRLSGEDTTIKLTNNKKKFGGYLGYAHAYHQLPVAHHFVIEDELYIKNFICSEHAKEHYEQEIADGHSGKGWSESIKALDDAIEQHEKQLSDGR